MPVESTDSPGVGAICERCGSLYCPTPNMCAQWFDAQARADVADLRKCIVDLTDRVMKLESASKDGFAVKVSWKDMYEDAERRVKVWRERYERRFEENQAVEDVVNAARTFIRGNQTGATATERKRKLRSAIRLLDSPKLRTP